MSIGLFIGFCYLMYHLFTAGNGVRGMYFRYYLLSWFFISIAVSLLYASVQREVEWLRVVPWLILLFIVAFPSFIAQIFIRVGWVRASYYLGRIASFRHANDIPAGALFYGWLALQRRPEEEKPLLKSWLDKKVERNGYDFGTGRMVMYVLLNSEKVSDREVYDRLRVLKDASPQGVPSNLGAYVFKWMLASDLAGKNWEDIVTTCNQWRLVRFIPLASYIVAYHARATNSEKIELGMFAYPIVYLLAGRPSWVKDLPMPKVLTKGNNDSDSNSTGNELIDVSQEQVITAEWQAYINSSDEQVKLDAGWKVLFEDESFKKKWLERVSELSNFNQEKILATLEESISDFLSVRGGVNIESDAVYEEIEHGLSRIRILMNAVEKRRVQRALLNGNYEFKEWLRIHTLIRSLSQYDQIDTQVYYLVRDISWNWVADLYNIKKEKGLAFLISKSLRPLVVKHGDNELAKILYGVYSNEFN